MQNTPKTVRLPECSVLGKEIAKGKGKISGPLEFLIFGKESFMRDNLVFFKF